MGSNIQTISCDVDGGWTAWQDDGTCNKQIGILNQIRSCTNPTPLNNGLDCVGPSTQEVACELKGECGAAHTQNFSTLPDTDLCTSGVLEWIDEDATDLEWNWKCKGANLGQTDSCVAGKKVGSIIIDNPSVTCSDGVERLIGHYGTDSEVKQYAIENNYSLCDPDSSILSLNTSSEIFCYYNKNVAKWDPFNPGYYYTKISCEY